MQWAANASLQMNADTQRFFRSAARGTGIDTRAGAQAEQQRSVRDRRLAAVITSSLPSDATAHSRSVLAGQSSDPQRCGAGDRLVGAVHAWREQAWRSEFG